MKIKILNPRLRANGGKYAAGDVVSVTAEWIKDAKAAGLEKMFEEVKEAKGAKK